MLRSIFISMLLLGYSLYCNAQNKQIENLTKFMQTKFDSCVVYYSYSNWIHPPNFLIIGKSKDKICYYSYKPPINNKTVISDTSTYLSSYNPKKERNYWGQLFSTDIWIIDNYVKKRLQIHTDSSVITYFIADGDQHDFYLITKYNIRKLHFYAPGFYNEHLPDKKLQPALNAINVFNKIFLY